MSYVLIPFKFIFPDQSRNIYGFLLVSHVFSMEGSHAIRREQNLFYRKYRIPDPRLLEVHFKSIEVGNIDYGVSLSR